MSTVTVPVARVEDVKPHPNADRLEIARLLGWQVVVRKGAFREGQVVVYVPPDTVVPEALSDALGVTQYLSRGRVRQVKLRQEPSFGFAFDPAELGDFLTSGDVRLMFQEGDNVAGLLGITKYEPPVNLSAGDAAPDNALFTRYTDIENLRHFPDAFVGRSVVVTEKVHGTNCRVGIVDHEYMAGSHALRRRRPEADNFRASVYWYPLSLNNVKDLLDGESVKHRTVVLYGEVYGRVQSLHYGVPRDVAFVAFDLSLDGQYVDPHEFARLCDLYGVPRVPLLYAGEFISTDHIKELSEGPSRIPGADHYREGAVVEATDGVPDPRFGRPKLKYVGDTYLFGGVDTAGPDEVE